MFATRTQSLWRQIVISGTENSLGHFQHSGISRPLIIGLGVAVAFVALMAGWFALTVRSGDDASTEVATAADDIPATSTISATTPAPVAAPALNDHVLASDTDSTVPTFVPLPTPRRPRPRPIPFPPPRPQMAALQMAAQVGPQGEPQAEPPTFFDFLNGRAR
jgi:hypothetical protein